MMSGMTMAAMEFLIYQLPVAALLLLVVWRFMKYISESRKDWLSTVTQITEKFEHSIDAHIAGNNEQKKELMHLIQENTVALNNSTRVMSSVERLLRDDATEREFKRRTRDTAARG